jgi:hypothetical protein
MQLSETQVLVEKKFPNWAAATPKNALFGAPKAASPAIPRRNCVPRHTLPFVEILNLRYAEVIFGNLSACIRDVDHAFSEARSF